MVCTLQNCLKTVKLLAVINVYFTNTWKVQFITICSIQAVWYDLSRKWIRLKCIIRILSLYLTTFIQGEEFQDSKIQDLKNFWIKMEFFVSSLVMILHTSYFLKLRCLKDDVSNRSFGVTSSQPELAIATEIRSLFWDPLVSFSDKMITWYHVTSSYLTITLVGSNRMESGLARQNNLS